MAFNLKKVLKALLLSTNRPLSIKDIQGAFTRFHEQAAAFPLDEEASVEGEAPSAAPAVAPAAPVAAPAPEALSEPVAVIEAPVAPLPAAAESAPVVGETAPVEAAATVESIAPPAEPLAPVAPPVPAKRSRKSKAAAAAAAAAEAKVSAPVTEATPSAPVEAAAPAASETPAPADTAPAVMAENAIPAEAVAATPPSDVAPVAEASIAAADTAPASASASAGESIPAEPAAAVTDVAAAATPPAAPRMIGEEPAEISLEITPKDPELYMDVPSLVTGTQIREVMAQIAEELRVSDEGIVLIEASSGFRLVTHPRFGKWIRILRQEPPPTKLNQSSIETLAVIAYRQPVTRGEIETIRGVSAEAGITKLLERELIYIVGRADAPGRPIQYGTTDGFLEFVGIKSLDELPASDVLSSRQIDEWLKTNASGHKPTDTDMGLADEQLPLDAPVPPPRTNDDIPLPGGGGGETASTATPQT